MTVHHRRTALAAAVVAPLAAVGIAGIAGLAQAQTQAGTPTHTTTYAGHGVAATQLSTERLAATDEDFVDYVERLTRRGDAAAADARQTDCTGSTVVTVKKWTSRGFAFGDYGQMGPCPSGGAVQIYVREDGRWTRPAALTTQEQYRCPVLHRFDVPVDMFVTRDCYVPRTGRETTYRAYESRR